MSNGKPMPDGGFEMDFSDFDKKFTEYALRVAPKAAEQGIFEALSLHKLDCDTVVPKTPHLEGNLRSDCTMILEGITEGKVVEIGDKHKGNVSPTKSADGKSIVAKLVFRMPYAAKWHEAVNKKVNWSEDGVGAKYAERKLMMFMKKYVGIVADAIKGVS